MGNQKNTFFGNDGFFADWLPTDFENGIVNSNFAKTNISEEMLNLYRKANPGIEI